MRLKDGATLRRWRLLRGMTQDQLGALARCSQTMIYKLETGRTRTLSEDLAIQIAHWLEVPLEDLFVARDSPGVRRATNSTRTIRRRKGRAA